jgi:uncharacterized caspase-like protein
MDFSMKLNVLKAFAAFSGGSRRFSNLLRAAVLALATVLTSFAAGSARADDKIALVIGNSQYRYVPALTNPTNDAADVAASLQRLGFKVKHLSDLDYNGFRRALIEFGSEARTADKAVIFYAGHGVEIDGKNWLIPVDAEIKSEIDVYAEGINLETLIDLSVLPKVVGLIVLDACRNNPFASAAASDGRSVTAPNPPASNGTPPQPTPSPATASDATLSLASPRGLAPVDVTDNVLVAFSAAAGTTANDGTGRNSPYSGALLNYVEKPGLEINYLFRDVHDDVLKATLNTQEPAVYGTLSKDEIFLKEGQASIASTDDKGDAEKLAWSFVRGTNDIGVLRRFSTQFPASAHRAEVVARTAQLENAEKFAWEMVEHQPSASSYKAFLDLYPFGDHADQARTTLASLTTSSPNAADTQPVSLPQPPAATYPVAAASPGAIDKPDETSDAIETAWDVLKGSKDENVVGRFAEKFPSLRHHRLLPGSDFALRPVNSTEWMLKTADDDDVNRCFGGDSAACVNAIDKYPDYVQLRFQLCRTTRRPEDQADKQKGRSDDCMQDAVDDARARGFLVSAFTRSAEEEARNQAYRVAVQEVQQHIGNVVSDTVNNVVGNIVSGVAGNAAATAAADAASAAAAGGIPAFTPVLIPPPTPRWETRLSSLKSAISTPNLNRGGVTPSPMVHSISPSAGTNAANKASNTVPGTISRTTINAISKGTTNAASKAASSAASHATSHAAFNAANRAAATAASSAASRSASHAASRAVSNAVSNSVSRAVSRAAAHAASKAASNAASNAASHVSIPSDIRLKRDIVALGRTADGLQLYRYRYIGDDVFYVGVMAQEVAERVPDAVTRGADGYLRVDYGKLGLTFMTSEEWTRRNAEEKKN